MSLIHRPVARATLLLAVAVIASMTIPGPTVAAGVTITIGDRFDPETVHVAPGTQVTWVNASGNRHRVRTTAGPVKIDSGNLEPGERFAATLSVVGTYRYRDAREPEDRSFWATIVVSERSGSGGGTGAGASPPGPASLPTTGSVGMAGRAFGPSQVTIAAGGTVTWRNDDDRAHTVTATGQAFDSGTLESGATFRQTFSSVGSFAYRCVIHPEMSGTIVVRASGASTAPPTPLPPNPSPSPTPAPTATPTPAPASASPTLPGPTGSATASLQVVDFAFEPGTLRIPAGTQVTVVNAGEAPHTITAADGSFDSGTIPAAGTWSSTFALPGTFPYRCAIHPDMTGVLEVTAASATEPSPSPAALVPGAVESTATPGAVGGPSTTAEVANRATQPSDYLRVLVGILLTGTAAVLFMRTIGGVARRPDQG